MTKPIRRFRPATLAASAVLLAGSLASMQALAIQPFSATYSASYMGLQANGRMTLAQAGGNRWTYTLSIQSSIAQLSQSTTFEDDGGQWKPLSGTDSSQLLIKQKGLLVTRYQDYDSLQRLMRPGLVWASPEFSEIFRRLTRARHQPRPA